MDEWICYESMVPTKQFGNDIRSRVPRAYGKIL
jgi:hypothetical protein